MGIIGAAEAQSQTLFCCQISSTRVIARTTTSFSSLSLAPPLSSLLWPARPWTLASTAPRKIPAIKIPPNNLQTSTRRRVHWCGWRIVISPKISQDSPSCYHSLMRHLVVLFIHFIAVLARLLGPGGVRSLIAESLLLKHQILILNRSRKPSPHLHLSDRILAGLLSGFLRPPLAARLAN